MSERVRPELWPHSELPVREIRATTGEIILVDGDYDGEYLASYQWRVSPQLGYATRQNVSLGRLITGTTDPKLVVTYRNGNKLDCRSANLEVKPRTKLQAEINARKRGV